MVFSKKIVNPKTELTKKKGLNDFDIVNMARTTEKSLCHAYVTAMEDICHESLYALLTDMLKESSQQQRKLLDLQFQHGWTTFTQSDERAVKELEEEFSEAKQQLK